MFVQYNKRMRRVVWIGDGGTVLWYPFLDRVPRWAISFLSFFFSPLIRPSSTRDTIPVSILSIGFPMTGLVLVLRQLGIPYTQREHFPLTTRHFRRNARWPAGADLFRR